RPLPLQVHHLLRRAVLVRLPDPVPPPDPARRGRLPRQGPPPPLRRPGRRDRPLIASASTRPPPEQPTLSRPVGRASRPSRLESVGYFGWPTPRRAVGPVPA